MPYFPTPEIWTQVKEPPKVVVMGRPHGTGVGLGARGSAGYSQATLNYQNRNSGGWGTHPPQQGPRPPFDTRLNREGPPPQASDPPHD